MRPDWTVPFDDILTVRFRTCQWCSQPADELDLWSGPSGEAAAIAMCRRALIMASATPFCFCTI
jgi:hypothetical protein